MKATGYDLREAIKRQTLRRDTAEQQFKDSLVQFPSDKDKPQPKDALRQMTEADEAICQLHTLQQWYNQRVMVAEIKAPLALAVKLVGVYGRHEQLLREAAGEKSGGRRHTYLYRHEMPATSRSKDEEHAVRMFPQQDAAKQAEQVAVRAGKIRTGIAKACGAEIEIPDDIIPGVKLAALFS